MTIRIVNWSSYQSYKDRRPPWIRFHRAILDNFDYHAMSANARALLPMLWLLASEDEDPVSGSIRISYERIAFRLRLPLAVLSDSIAECTASGFVEIIQSCNETVTKPLQNRNETVTPEKSRVEERRGEKTEERREEENDGFAFFGKVIRLTKPDFDRAVRDFPNIDDMHTELAVIDAKFCDSGMTRKSKWYGTLNAWLKLKNDRIKAERETPWNERPGNRMASPAGG